MKISKNNIAIAIFFFVLLGFFMLFFTNTQPLIPLNLDDWQYMSHIRKAYPIWKDWNPTRVFPEVFYPIVASVGNWIFRPLFDNYLDRIVLTNALVVTGCIILYVDSFRLMVKKLFLQNDYEVLILTALFVVMHFMPFCVNQIDNQSAFYAIDVCCYYYYTIPSLLQFALVFHIIAKPELLTLTYYREDGNITKGAMLMTALYFMLFSNLYSSIIISSVCGIMIIMCLIQEKNNKNNLLALFFNVCEKCFIPLCVIVIWLLVVIPFDMFSGRADSLSNHDSFGSLLVKSLLYLCENKYQKTGLLLLFIPIVIATYMALKKKITNIDIRFQICTVFIICSTISLLFLLLLSSQVKPVYMTYANVLLPVYSFIIAGSICCLAIIQKIFKKISYLLPLVVIICLTKSNTSEYTYRPLDYGCEDNITPATAYNISNSIINQIIKAYNDGQEEVVVIVPKLKDDFWPLHNNTGDAISRTLCEHGVIMSHIKVTFKRVE